MSEKELEKFKDILPTKEQLEEADESYGVIYLVKGQLDDGEDVWAYASIQPSKIFEFKQAEATGSYDLADYGQIIKSGIGKEPPADVIEQMKEEYHIQPDFEKKITDEFKKVADTQNRKQDFDTKIQAKIDELKKKKPE